MFAVGIAYSAEQCYQQSLKNVFREGQRACQAQLSAESNPYQGTPDTTWAVQWLNGYLHEKERVK